MKTVKDVLHSLSWLKVLQQKSLSRDIWQVLYVTNLKHFRLIKKKLITNWLILQVNVVKGLKLYEDIFTDSELCKLTDFVNEIHVAGQNGELSGKLTLISECPCILVYSLFVINYDNFLG